MEFKDYVREDSCKYVMTLELEEFCSVFGKDTSVKGADGMKVDVYYRLIITNPRPFPFNALSAAFEAT